MTLHRLAARCSAAAALAVLAATAAHATNFSAAVYAGAKDDLSLAYKTQRDACNSLTGNTRDVCVESARGQESVARAQLEYNDTGKADDERKLYTAQHEAQYDIAKEKCDGLSGNAKDVCVQSAKSTRDKAQADYKVARELCDGLAGDAKDVCVASAKARCNLR